MNKTFFSRANELLETATTNTKINQILSLEFKLRSDETSRIFKSFFGKTIKEELNVRLTPTREQIENALIIAKDSKEMCNILNLQHTSSLWKGLLDREFGYSTFQSAKAKFLATRTVKEYNPSRDDNLSIIISQRLGDGNIPHDRDILRIAHGINQSDYLIFKVALLHKAFPNANPISNVRIFKHAQGHEYASYYSGIFSRSYINKVRNMSNKEMIDNLTPLGWLLWYLDDGFYSISKAKDGEYYTHNCGISIHNEELQDLAIEKLKCYGFSFNKNKNDIRIQSMEAISSFMNDMLRPFAHIVPDCMKYKIEMKI